MQSHLILSDPLSGRASKFTSSDNSKTSQSPQQAESSNPVRRKAQSIEIGQLPMVRKGGGTAIIFDRMDQNGNGVLTRAELISYRLAPMVTQTAVEISPMPAETMKQIGQAAKAKIESEASGKETTADGQQAPANDEWSLEAVFGIADTSSTVSTSAPEPAPIPSTGAPQPAPSSLPESVVMAQAATSAAPEPIFA